MIYYVNFELFINLFSSYVRRVEYGSGGTDNKNKYILEYKELS